MLVHVLLPQHQLVGRQACQRQPRSGRQCVLLSSKAVKRGIQHRPGALDCYLKTTHDHVMQSDTLIQVFWTVLQRRHGRNASRLGQRHSQDCSIAASGLWHAHSQHANQIFAIWSTARAGRTPSMALRKSHRALITMTVCTRLSGVSSW